MAELNTWPGWQYVRRLGGGAFGQVYEIYRKDEYGGHEDRAALKVIRIPQDPGDVENAYSDGMTKEMATEYFRSYVTNITEEFALMAKMKGYTNIVSYEDHMVIEHKDDIGWDILIRMELLTPLKEYVKEQPLDEKGVITLGVDICRALEICRKYKIIHRDIKPENIFVNDQGNFKLGDFGIARTVEKTVSNLSVKGTYLYMAPEVYFNRPYGPTVDIYSLGIVLYYYLNQNHLPFLPMGQVRAQDYEQARDRRMTGEEQVPAPVGGSAQLKGVVLKAIAHDPANRYQTPTEFRRALERCLGSEECAPEEFFEDDLKPLPAGDPAAEFEVPLDDVEGTTCGGVYGGGRSSGPPEEDDSGKTVYGGGTPGGGKRPPVAAAKPRAKLPFFVGGGLLAVALVALAVVFLPRLFAKTPATYSLVYQVESRSQGTLTSGTEKNAQKLCYEVEQTDAAIEITAVPATGYEFAEWSDGVKTATRKDENFSEDLQVTALFKEKAEAKATATPSPTPVKTYTVVFYIPVEGGGILRDKEGNAKEKLSYTVTSRSDAITVTAEPQSGYEFVRWSDGVTTETRTESDFSRDISVSAIFAEKASSTAEPSSTGSASSSSSAKQASTPTPTQAPTATPTPAPSNWKVSASVSGSLVSFTLSGDSGSATVSYRLVFKASAFAYPQQELGTYTAGSYSFDLSRPGPSGEYTLQFMDASGRVIGSQDCTL
jgi:serine/threonine protein kinase